jgi:hypothetical protein
MYALYYCLPPYNLTANDANNWCSQYDGLLYNINNSNELNILINIYNANQFPIWIGARASSGLDFRWSFNNQQVSSSYWLAGEPNSGHPIEPCVIAGWGISTYHLNDLRCDRSFRFLCEKR